jgi:hypothetical protein
VDDFRLTVKQIEKLTSEHRKERDQKNLRSRGGMSVLRSKTVIPLLRRGGFLRSKMTGWSYQNEIIQEQLERLRLC